MTTGNRNTRIVLLLGLLTKIEIIFFKGRNSPVSELIENCILALIAIFISNLADES